MEKVLIEATLEAKRWSCPFRTHMAIQTRARLWLVSTATGQALTEPRIIHTNTVYSLASVRTGERVYINVVDEQGDTYEEPYTLTKVAETDLGDQQVLELTVGDYQYTKEGLMIGKYEGQLVMEAIEYVASLEVYAPYVYFNIQYNVTYKFENRKTNEVVYFKVREGAGDDEYTNSFGWVQNGSDWYYQNKYEHLRTGWLQVNDSWYYLDPTDGCMQTGWIHLNKQWYYLNANGAMQTEWAKIGQTWYFFDTNGRMQTGWVKVRTNWYYLGDNGAMQTGLHRYGNKWYYFPDSGVMQTGWTKVGDRWYYLNNSGHMQAGWVKGGTTWYYLSTSGHMQTGWQRINGNWYYLNSSGAMQTGWIKEKNKWYYLGTSGVWQK